MLSRLPPMSNFFHDCTTNQLHSICAANYIGFLAWISPRYRGKSPLKGAASARYFVARWKGHAGSVREG
jgi:hypothetical protein